MLEWIKKNKKLVIIIGIIGTLAAIIVVNIFKMNEVKYNEERDYLSIGTRQEDGDTISFALEEEKNPEKIEAIREILAQAKKSELTDETAGDIKGKEIIFDISYGKYTETKPEMTIEMWIQQDGTAIYREALTKEYYTLDKDSTKKMEEIFK